MNNVLCSVPLVKHAQTVCVHELCLVLTLECTALVTSAVVPLRVRCALVTHSRHTIVQMLHRHGIYMSA
jgi:hypothetical protein